MKEQEHSLDNPSPLVQAGLWTLLAVLVASVVWLGWTLGGPGSSGEPGFLGGPGSTSFGQSVAEEIPDPLRFKLSEAWVLMGADQAQRAGELSGDAKALAQADRLISELEDEAPRVPTVHFYRGLHRLAVDQPEAAVEALKRAAELDPTRIPVWLTLSAVHVRLKDYGAAENALRQVLEREPENLSALGNLGQVLWLMDRKDESKAVYRRQLELEGRPLVAEGPV